MNSGMYSALSGNLMAMKRMDIISNNLANVNTPGYKKDRMLFESMLAGNANPPAVPQGSTADPILLKDSVIIDYSPGTVSQTGNNLDLAIDGDGLFVVQKGGGVAYTRAGDFVVDVNRMLVTQQGYPVLDTAGHTITLPQQNFTVGSDGTISWTNPAGATVFGPRVALVGWPPGGVTRLGENLYAAGGALAPATGQIRQETLEGSNTDVALAMSDMIALQRNFQMSSRALSLQDGTIGDATQLGRLR